VIRSGLSRLGLPCFGARESSRRSGIGPYSAEPSEDGAGSGRKPGTAVHIQAKGYSGRSCITASGLASERKESSVPRPAPLAKGTAERQAPSLPQMPLLRPATGRLRGRHGGTEPLDFRRVKRLDFLRNIETPEICGRVSAFDLCGFEGDLQCLNMIPHWQGARTTLRPVLRRPCLTAAPPPRTCRTG
jgi:hypothetical protein